jgi:Na+-transporting NADH:ubiquinone oxidoreductase subunit NqrF
VPLPKNVPSARVVSVAGVPVPFAPSGSFAMPDVTINQAMAVPVVIEAANVPPGMVAQVYIISGSAQDQIVSSSPLTGMFQKSSATASVKIPPGFSRVYVRVIWWDSRCTIC